MVLPVALGFLAVFIFLDCPALAFDEIDGLLSGTLEIAREAGVAAPYTESLLGLIRLRAETSAQYRRSS